MRGGEQLSVVEVGESRRMRSKRRSGGAHDESKVKKISESSWRCNDDDATTIDEKTSRLSGRENVSGSGTDFQGMETEVQNTTTGSFFSCLVRKSFLVHLSR